MSQVYIKNIMIQGVAGAVPENALSTSDFASAIADSDLLRWTEKHDILYRHVASEEQTTSDLGYSAAEALLQKNELDRTAIGGILVATSTPDYRSPATACVLQGRLGLSKDCIAFDLNVGDCGFIVGLQAASAILSTINKDYLLLIAGDTTSKQLDRTKGFSLFFGDGAGAILLKKTPESGPEFVVSTGVVSSTIEHMIITDGGFRNDSTKYEQGYLHFSEEVWWQFYNQDFINRLDKFLAKHSDFIDPHNSLLILPQMGSSTLVPLSKSLRSYLSENDRVFEQYANTRGASVPVTLAHLFGADSSTGPLTVIAAALGEGISWGFSVFSIDKSAILPLLFTGEYFAEGVVAREI